MIAKTTTETTATTTTTTITTTTTRGDGREEKKKGEGGERGEEGGGEGKLLWDGGTDRDIEGSTKGPRGPKIANYFKIRSRKNQPNEPEMSDFQKFPETQS